MHPLVSHPAFPATAPFEVEAALSGDTLQFVVRGAVDRLLIPPPAPPTRTDELWRHCCFELFVLGEGEGYTEFNFSPSGEWAAYAFDGYRAGMRNAETEPPVIRVEHDAERLAISVTLPPFAPSWSKGVSVARASTSSGRTAGVGVSAILEETDGTKSYWALRHPPGPPDVHHPDCFALELPAPPAP